MSRKYTDAENAWIKANYSDGDVNDTLDSFEERFGWRPSKQAIYQKAYKLGVLKRRSVHDRGKLVERAVRWSSAEDAHLTEWMLANDRGHSMDVVIEAFRREFGFTLARGQVSQFRARYGVGERRSSGGRRRRPIGAERDSGKGYTLVKVAERANMPMSKDNWRMKHHLIWEEANGRPVPDGCEIVFADRDCKNFDPSNLVAVEKRLVGIINGQGFEYHDAESLRTAVLRAELVSKARHVKNGGTRTCAICGARFSPTGKQLRYMEPVRTCPACLAAGHKAKRSRRETA